MRRRIPDRHVVGLDEWLTVVRLGVNRQFQEKLLKEGGKNMPSHGVAKKKKARMIVGWRTGGRADEEEAAVDGRWSSEEQVDSRADGQFKLNAFFEEKTYCLVAERP